MTANEYQKKLRAINEVIRKGLDEKALLTKEYEKSILEANGLKPGDRVKDYEGKEYEAVRVELFTANLAHLIGRKIKKDGTPGEREVTVYGYELKQRP